VDGKDEENNDIVENKDNTNTFWY